ncbi:MAG: MoaD/ThiS family protein [Gemmatimonadota bacterium]
MPHVEFAPQLQRHVPCPPQTVDARSLRGALDIAFAAAPGLRAYVLDDQGAVRKHVAVFINGELLHDRVLLERALAPGDRVYVAQALSGG